MEIKIDEWEGCYDGGWKGWITPESFSHPAKFSRALIERIYDHALNEGWIEEGGIVLDPFGGVCLGGLNAMAMGLNWVGVELEEKFVKLGEQNIELWNRELAGWPNLGTARIVQGDSRRLKDVIGEASLIVSSPPYAETHNQGGDQATHPGMKWKHGERTDRGRVNRTNFKGTDYGCTKGNLANLPEGNFQDVIEKADLVVSSPPFLEVLGSSNSTKFMEKIANQPGSKRFGRTIYKKREVEDYGHTSGNLANLKEGDFDLIYSSPPYAECIKSGGDGIDWNKIKGEEGKPNRSLGRGAIADGYSQNSNNLGSMKEGSIDAVISSPPYEGALGNRQHEGDQAKYVKRQEAYRLKHPEFKRPKGESMAYPASEGNLGSKYGDTFWSASREIVQQCYELLKDGGHAIWVTKSYCKKGAIVDFPMRWKNLCESVGFKTVCEHRAMLVKTVLVEKSDGSIEIKEIQRKSFFRRLHESKHPDLRIDWEMVQCMVKK